MRAPHATGGCLRQTAYWYSPWIGKCSEECLVRHHQDSNSTVPIRSFCAMLHLGRPVAAVHSIQIACELEEVVTCSFPSRCCSATQGSSVAAVENAESSQGGSLGTRGSPAVGKQHCRERARPLVSREGQSSVCRAFELRTSNRSDCRHCSRKCRRNHLEPPYTDPYVRWCGRGRRVTAAPMPIKPP